MSWLSLIYESIVNEIGADDAYNRFYSSIPREDYDQILQGEQNPDKFMQFILNCVRDGKTDKDGAVEAVSAFRSADQLIKQNVVNKFKAGEYESADDVTADIKYMASGGSILSRKKFAKEGYIKIKETDKWLVTCTTNYLASNHYFGDSHWCTASDRDGRYDGWRMFLRYGIHADCVLIQYTWKGQVIKKKKEEDEERPEPLDEENKSMGFEGDAIKEDYSKFQAETDGSDIGMICDYFDNTIAEHELKHYVGDELFSILYDKEIIKWLKNRQEEQHKKETEYQKSQDEVIKKKKERKERERMAAYNRLMEECQEYNDAKEPMILSCWEKFINDKEYLNPEIIQKIVDRDIESIYEDDELTDDNFKETNFAGCVTVEPYGRTGYAIMIAAVRGISKYVNTNYDDNEEEVYSIETEASRCHVSNGGVIVIYDDKKIIGSYLGDALGNMALQHTELNGNYSMRFLVIKPNEKSTIFYDAENSNTFSADKLKGRVRDIFSMENGTFLIAFDSRFSISDWQNYAVYDSKDGSVREFEEGVDPDFYAFNYRESFALRYTDEQYIYHPSSNIYAQFVPTMEYPNDVITNDKKDTVSPGDVIGLSFKGGKYNAIKYGEKEFIFGFWGAMINVIDDDAVNTWNNKSDFALCYKNGRYTKRDDKLNTVDCDKYGVSAQEKLEKDNFRKWKEAGGHSPEAQAQMDKMWADRNGDFIGGEDDALHAWNDNDRGLDRREGYINLDTVRSALSRSDDDSFGDIRRAVDSVDNLEPNPNWGGRVGIRDNSPNSELRDNAFYRVDRQGRPIDTPWHEEDEIPANLSDRVVRRNRINEQFNKMKSIWDRMGLNE